ncbi:MAG: CorA family divalent cation transporter, partial [Bacteroidota bacterium]
QITQENGGRLLDERALYDHTIQIADLVEAYRDTLNSLQDLFASEVSLRMNQIMQVLTIVSALFIPLTFLAGIYGMNFEYIPELQFRYGYFVLLGVMLVVFVGLLWFFRRKRWI